LPPPGWEQRRTSSTAVGHSATTARRCCQLTLALDMEAPSPAQPSPERGGVGSEAWSAAERARLPLAVPAPRPVQWQIIDKPLHGRDCLTSPSGGIGWCPASRGRSSRSLPAQLLDHLLQVGCHPSLTLRPPPYMAPRYQSPSATGAPCLWSPSEVRTSVDRPGDRLRPVRHGLELGRGPVGVRLASWAQAELPPARSSAGSRSTPSRPAPTRRPRAVDHAWAVSLIVTNIPPTTVLVLTDTVPQVTAAGEPGCGGSACWAIPDAWVSRQWCWRLRSRFANICPCGCLMP